MKALVYTNPHCLEFQDVPDPLQADEENLIAVRSVGICGSDMHAYSGHDARRPAPLILGHEAAGDVIAGPLAGKRVTINPLVTCQICDMCQSGRSNLCTDRQIISMPPREGAFAEQVVMPTRNLIEVPDAISFDHAALAEPLAVCWHGVRLGLAAMVTPPDQAQSIVIGGGAIGVGSALSLSAKGIKDISISEPNPKRRAVLKNIRDYEVHDPSYWTSRASDYDIVIDTAGFAASRTFASEIVKPGGVIVHIGLGEDTGGLNVRRMTLQEIHFIGTYTYTEHDFTETTQAIFDGIFGSLDWIEKRPLKEGAEAFGALASGSIATPKIVLNP